MNDQIKDRVQDIVQRTYDEHGFRARPWGVTPHNPNRCSYKAGCSIGISVTPELALDMDAHDSSIGELLEIPAFREGILGTNKEPPAWVSVCLQAVQDQHDDYATDSGGFETQQQQRAAYRHQLEKIAAKYGLTLRQPEAA